MKPGDQVKILHYGLYVPGVIKEIYENPNTPKAQERIKYASIELPLNPGTIIDRPLLTCEKL